MDTDYFRLNDTDFGIGEIRFSIDELANKLTLEVGANPLATELIGADENAEFGWVLYPPKLYLRAVPFERVVGGKQVTVDEQLLDDYDVALYMLKHYDIRGMAAIMKNHFTFIGYGQVDGAETSVAINCLLPE